MSYNNLPLDVHNDIYSFLDNKDLCSIMLSSRETQKIAHRYLQPHTNNDRGIKVSARKGYTDALRSLLKDPG